MKKKTVDYTDEPIELGKRVKDFLPESDILRNAPVHVIKKSDVDEEPVPVTIDISKDLLSKLKKKARQKRVGYQHMIVSILRQYSQNNLHQ